MLFCFVPVHPAGAGTSCVSSSKVTVSTLGDLPKKKTIQPGIIALSVKNNQLFINGLNTHVTQVQMTPDTGSLEIDGQLYSNVLIQVDNGQCCVSGERQSASSDEILENFKKEHTYCVRVLLDEKNKKGDVDWCISCPDGFVIKDPSRAKNIFVHESDLVINSTDASIIINGKKYMHAQVCIAPQKGHIYFNNQEYAGTFSSILYKNQRLLVNTLGLEDYVCSVLSSESWPGWPLEVNKVFAIASRSYVLAMVIRSQASKLPYHIKNTKVHQTYEGTHTNEMLKTAVDETRGVFLSYDNKPILAMFDSCCGGVITANIADFDFEKAPYLARNYPCVYCKPCSIYQWETEYSLRDLTQRIGAPFSAKNKIKQIKIVKKDDAGLVSKINVKSGKNSVNLTGKKLYSLLSGVKSFCFTVVKKENSVVFKGRGYGHHIGLCQWGAREMVRAGKTYKEILKFYYPGTVFSHLT